METLDNSIYKKHFQWKIGALKNFMKGSTLVCSNQYLLEKEIDHQRTVFIEINYYPAKTVDNIIRNEL